MSSKLPKPSEIFKEDKAKKKAQRKANRKLLLNGARDRFLGYACLAGFVVLGMDNLRKLAGNDDVLLGALVALSILAVNAVSKVIK